MAYDPYDVRGTIGPMAEELAATDTEGLPVDIVEEPATVPPPRNPFDARSVVEYIDAGGTLEQLFEGPPTDTDTGGEITPVPTTAEGEPITEDYLLESIVNMIETGQLRMEMLDPIMLEELGYKWDEEAGEYVKIPHEEWYAGLSPLEQSIYDLQMAATEHSQAALAGELEVPESIDVAMKEQRTYKEAQLRQQGLKPGDTGYDRAMAELDHQFDLLLYGVRHGEISAAEAISAARAGQTGAAGQAFQQGAQAYQAMPGAMAGGFQFPLAYMQTGKGMEMQYDISERQIEAQKWMAGQQRRGTETAGFWGGVGSMAGLGALALLSSEEFKEDIEEYEDSALDKLLDTGIYRFKYKDGIADSDYHIGMIAEEAPDELKVLDGKAVDLYSTIGMTIAAVRELAKEVRGE